MHKTMLTVVFTLATFAAAPSQIYAQQSRFDPATPPQAIFSGGTAGVALNSRSDPSSSLGEQGAPRTQRSRRRIPHYDAMPPRYATREANTPRLPLAEDLQPSLTAPAPLESRQYTPSHSENSATADSTAVPGDDNIVVMVMPSVSIATKGPTEINVGRAATYVITIQNRSDAPVDGLQIHASVPASAELLVVNPQPAASDQGALRFDLDRVPPGATRHIQLVLKAIRRGEIDLATRATLSADALVKVQAAQPELSIACQAPEEADLGESIEYTLTITNRGDGTAEGVFLAAESYGLQAEEPSTFEVGSLQPGQSKEVRLGADAKNAGTMESTFRVWDDSGQQAHARSIVRIRQAMLSLSIAGPKANYLQRDEVYQIELTNPENTPAREIVITAHLPAGLQAEAGELLVDTDSELQTLQWQVDHLAPHKTQTIRFKARATGEGDQRIQVQAAAVGTADAHATHRTLVISRPSLSAMVTGPKFPLEVGVAGSFDIALYNTGAKDLSSLRVQVLPPAGLRLLPGDGYKLTDNGLTFSPPHIPAGAKLNLVFQAAGEIAGDHVVRVELSSDSLSHALIVEGSVYVFDPTADYASLGP